MVQYNIFFSQLISHTNQLKRFRHQPNKAELTSTRYSYMDDGNVLKQIGQLVFLFLACRRKMFHLTLHHLLSIAFIYMLPSIECAIILLQSKNIYKDFEFPVKS